MSIIETKFLPPTMTLGARIAAKTYNHRIVMNCDDADDIVVSHNKAAQFLANRYMLAGEWRRIPAIDGGYIFIRVFCTTECFTIQSVIDSPTVVKNISFT